MVMRVTEPRHIQISIRTPWDVTADGPDNLDILSDLGILIHDVLGRRP